MTATLPVNSTVSESLSADDYYDPKNAYYYDFYQLNDLTPGLGVTVSVSSNNFDTWMAIYNVASGEFVAYDDNGGTGTNSSANFTPVFGDETSYVLAVSSAGVNSTGSYTVSTSAATLAMI